MKIPKKVEDYLESNKAFRQHRRQIKQAATSFSRLVSMQHIVIPEEILKLICANFLWTSFTQRKSKFRFYCSGSGVQSRSVCLYRPISICPKFSDAESQKSIEVQQASRASI